MYSANEKRGGNAVYVVYSIDTRVYKLFVNLRKYTSSSISNSLTLMRSPAIIL